MRYFSLLSLLLIAGCSLPSAISDGFSEIYTTYETEKEKYNTEQAKENNYGANSDTNKAIVAFVKGNLNEASDYATKALQENPQDAYALMVMAVVNDSLGLPQKAGFYYQSVLETKQNLPTTLGNYRLNLPQPLSKAALARLQVINLKQAPFIVNTDKQNAHTFEIKEVYTTMPPAVARAGGISGVDNYVIENTEVISGNFGEPRKEGLDLFSTEEKNIISRFLTLKALAESGYITKEEFIARRNYNIGGLLPLIKPRPANTIALPVPTTKAIIERFDAMKNAYELKSMTAEEYIAEREVILEALLPTSSLEKLPAPPIPTNLLEGADEVRQLEILLGLELITKKELNAEKIEIENILRNGGKSIPQKALSKADIQKPMPLISKK